MSLGVQRRRSRIGFFVALAGVGWLIAWATLWLAYHHGFISALLVASYYSVPALIVGAVLDAIHRSISRRKFRRMSRSKITGEGSDQGTS